MDLENVNEDSMKWELISAGSACKVSCRDEDMRSVSSPDDSESFEFESLQD